MHGTMIRDVSQTSATDEVRTAKVVNKSMRAEFTYTVNRCKIC